MTENLKNLENKITKFKTSEKVEKDAESEQDRAAENRDVGIRAGAELVISMSAGVFIGVLLDNWLGTPPLFLIIFLLTGVGTGFMNIYRITQNIGTSVGFAALHQAQKRAKNTP